MKKVILYLALIAISTSSALSLAPFKVGVFYTGSSATMVVRIVDYSNGESVLYTSSDITDVTGNSSGFAILDVVDNPTNQLVGIDPEDINTSTIIEILVNDNTYAQYRLDRLLSSQAQGGIFDNDGNLTPPENGGSDLGGDDQRWSSAYVLGNSVHIGPADGEANETEMKLSYDEENGIGTIKVDSEEIIDITEDKVTIDGETEVNDVFTATVGGNTIGNGNEGPQLTINGSSTNASLKEFIVNGDVQINGSLTVDGTVAQTPVGNTIGALASVIVLPGETPGTSTAVTWDQDDLSGDHSIGSIVQIYQSQDNENANNVSTSLTLLLNGVAVDLSDARDSYIITKTGDDGAGNTTWILISSSDN